MLLFAVQVVTVCSFMSKVGSLVSDLVFSVLTPCDFVIFFIALVLH